MEFKISKEDAQKIVQLASSKELFLTATPVATIDLKTTTDTADAIAYAMRSATRALDEQYLQARAFDRGFREGYDEAMWRVRRGYMPLYPKRCPCPDPNCYR